MYKIYDFKCLECGHVEERVVQDKEIQYLKCSVCKGGVKQLLGAPPFHLKGKNWSRDNYGLKKEN